VKIERKVLKGIIAHAKESGARECCGLMMTGRGEDATIIRALPAENEERERPEKRYLLGRKAYLQAIDLELSGEAKITGVYHSHPHGEPRPSFLDRECAHQGLIYLIVAVHGYGIKYAGWQFNGDDFARVPLELC
jgi:proteasome lid subunit RPN8/RPN11